MATWPLERKWMMSGISLALLLMGTVSYMSYQNATRLIASANQVRHTNSVLKTLTDVVTTLSDAESGRRGYILFGDEEELERYNSAIQSIDPKITRLQHLLNRDTEQQQRLAQLVTLITQRLILYRKSADLHQEAQLNPTQTKLIAELKHNNRRIRQMVTDLQTNEEELLEAQLAQSQIGFQSRLWIEFLGTLLTFGLLLVGSTLLYRQMVKRQAAETSQRALAQAKELGELKLNFFSMVSHEFRTPLSIILGSVQLLEAASSTIEPKAYRNLHRIQSSARLMTKLLTDILTLTRAEAGKLECNREWIDLEGFCLNLVEDVTVAVESSCLIKLDRQGQGTHAYLDEQLIYSVLNNLLSNAIKYSPQGGSIYFGFRCEPGLVGFEIQDQGIGITPEDLQTLYDPFYRGKNVGSISGSGLGLAVVKRCLELHHGTISVASELETGTRFTIHIPQPDPPPTGI